MVDTLTTTYDFTQPEVGGSDDTWGDKLNANWGKIDTLLTSVFPSGGPTTLGIPLLASTTPTLRFLETDAVSPAGQFALYGSATGSFSFVRYTAAAWGSPTNIWSYTASTDTFYVAPLTRLATTGGTVEIGHSTASTLEFMRATGTNYIKWPAVGSLLIQSDGGTNAINITTALVSTYPSTKLALTDGIVEIGNSTGSQINFKRAGINYITWPNAYSLRLQTDTSVDAISITGTAISMYPELNLAVTGGVVNIGNSSTSTIEYKRSSGGINYIKTVDGSTLRIQTTAGGNWASISSGAGWSAGTSDGRLKENIRDIHYGLDTILALRPVEFDWISEQRHDIGLIAQEVQPLIPEIVEVWEADPDNEGEIDTLAMRKDALTIVLIRAVQQLAARLEILEGARHA